MITDMDFGIPLPDGTCLSARIWKPETAGSEPVPAILEYLPYRKSDGTIDRDETMHPWFAEHGYACLRVDRRGCGESEGLYDDEYSEQELADGQAIIAWIAAQPWCNGNVGMQGISWGGFNALQLAARDTPALKAIISIGTTVDRYTDDIHYKGGIQLGENIGWAATSASWFSTPPHPDQRANWREIWLSRLENAPFLAERWTAETDRTDYWKHGSVRENFEALHPAILVIGGQQDGYRNAMAALLEGATCPVQGIMGPWGHKYPHISPIEPAIDYLSVALRWWDRWLKGIENGAEADAAYRVYVMDSMEPDPAHTHRPGRWLAFDNWPAPEVSSEMLAFGDGSLGAAEPFSAETGSNLAIGRAAGEFFPFGFGPGELPDDQTGDDALSVCFDSAPLEQDTALIGAPNVTLRLACDQPRGQVIVRLNDVRPDGTVALISLGMLDLRYRDGFERKVDLIPGADVDIGLTLDQCAYRLPKGHKLRVAVSSSYWPYCWPEGQTFTLTLSAGTLDLPVLIGDVPEVTFDRPQPINPRAVRQIEPPRESKTWGTAPDGSVTLDIVGDHGKRLDESTGLITSSTVSEHWSIHPDDPQSAQVKMIWTRGLAGERFETSTEVVMVMKGKSDAFDIEEEVRAWQGSQKVFDQRRKARVER